MATVTGLTAARMLEIEAASVVDGDVVGDNLFLTKHDGTQINAGSVRGPQGPSGQNGVDAAPGSVSVVGNTTPIRTSDGRVKTASPTETDDATPKQYVDTLVKGVELGANVDFNTLTASGIYTQTDGAEATLALNYPIARGGVLEVFTNSVANMVWQTYTPFGNVGTTFYKRGLFGTTWYPWYSYNSTSGAVDLHMWDLSGGNGQTVLNNADTPYVPTVITNISGVTRSGAYVTITKDGYYNIAGGGRITAGGVSAQRYAGVIQQRGGTALRRAGSNEYTANSTVLNTTRLFRALVGDVFYLNWYHTATATLTLDDGFGELFFTGNFVRPL